MASLTLNINVDNAMTESLVQKGKHVSLAEYSRLVRGLASGSIKGLVDVQATSANPVAATGVITPTQANVTNNDTITIGGVVITAATSGNGTTSFTIGGNLAATCTALAACLNANPTLSPHIVATATATTVTLAARLKGSLANLIVMSTSDATAFAFTQFAGGAGGPAGAVTSY